MHKHLVDHGITDTGFEVYAKALEEGLSVFSVFESDEIYVLWEEVVEEIQKELGLKAIATIGCFRIGADCQRVSTYYPARSGAHSTEGLEDI